VPLALSACFIMNVADTPSSDAPKESDATLTASAAARVVAEHGCDAICGERLGMAAEIPDAAYGACQCFSPATRLKIAATSSTSGVRQLPKWAFWLIVAAFALVVIGALVAGIVAQHVVRRKYKMKSGWSEPGL